MPNAQCGIAGVRRPRRRLGAAHLGTKLEDVSENCQNCRRSRFIGRGCDGGLTITNSIDGSSEASPCRRRAIMVGWLLLILVVRGLGLETSTAEARPLISDSPVGVSSAVYLSDPFGAERAMFSEAAAMGASVIRVDVELAGVFPDSDGQPNWSWLNQYVALARTYHLRVLAIIEGMPAYLAACPPGTPTFDLFKCPPADLTTWARDVGEMAAHTRGVIDYFEILNEPDGAWTFLGTPQQYAGMLAAAYDAIHSANAAAQVAFGGLADVGKQTGHNWINAVFATPGANALHKFDIANLHIRGRAVATGSVVCRWRRYFASEGFRGPLWVSETGYSARPVWQDDPSFQGGLAAQAAYLVTAIRSMIQNGAAKVFVTERDHGGGRYGTEGVLQTPNPLPADPTVVRRPSFYAVKRLASERWPAAAAAPACPTG